MAWLQGASPLAWRLVFDPGAHRAQQYRLAGPRLALLPAAAAAMPPKTQTITKSSVERRWRWMPEDAANAVLARRGLDEAAAAQEFQKMPMRMVEGKYMEYLVCEGVFCRHMEFVVCEGVCRWHAGRPHEGSG